MKPLAILLTIAVFAACVTGCFYRANSKTTAAHGTLLVILLERASSYPHLDEGVQLLTPSQQNGGTGILNSLRSGDVFAVIPIAHGPTQTPIIYPTLVNYQLFHVADKRKFVEGESEILQTVKPDKTPGCDLISALNEATSVLQDPTYQFCQKRLLIISNLDDTAGQSANVQLNGVRVNVLCCDDSSGVPGKVSTEKWRKFFVDTCHAQSVGIRTAIASASFRLDDTQ